MDRKIQEDMNKQRGRERHRVGRNLNEKIQERCEQTKRERKTQGRKKSE